MLWLPEVRQALKGLKRQYPLVQWFFICDQVKGSICTNYKQAKHYQADAIVHLGNYCECGTTDKVPTIHVETSPAPARDLPINAPVQRYTYLLDVIPNARRIGIVFGETISQQMEEQISLLKRLMRAVDKTVVLLSCHPLTNEKLENFEDIEAFIYVGCESSFIRQVVLQQKLFRRKVVGATEALLSLGLIGFDNTLLSTWKAEYKSIVEAHLLSTPSGVAEEQSLVAKSYEDTLVLSVTGSEAGLVGYKSRTYQGVGVALNDDDDDEGPSGILPGKQGIASQYRDEI